MIVCIVRHGETAWNKFHLIQGLTDNPLNATGRKQARKVAEYLLQKDPNWDLIVSSSLLRAQETARIIASKINYHQEIIIDERFRERNFGSLEGQTLNAKNYDIILNRQIPELELIDDVQKRVISGLNDLKIKYEVNKVLIVAHAQTIKSLLLYLNPHFDFRFPLKNSSMNYFEIKNGKISILKYNVTTDK